MDPKQVAGWYDVAVSYYAPFLHMLRQRAVVDTPSRATCRTANSLATSHLPGWPAPISRPQSESVAKYVVVDMFAKACAGKSTKEVIADAERAAEADLQAGLIVSTTALPAAVYVPAPRRGIRLPPLDRAGGRVQLADDHAAGAVPAALVGYPFVYGIWLSLEDRPVAKAGTFVGLANFVADCARPGVLAGGAEHLRLHRSSRPLLKMVGGLGLALVMNQDFRFKNLIRAADAAAVHRADGAVDHRLDVDPRSRLQRRSTGS